jgi:hypothetical protein
MVKNFRRPRRTDRALSLASIVVLMTFAGVALADKLPPTERKNTSPTMAKFYKVDGSGESKADNVTVPTLSKPEPEVSDAPPVNKPRPAKAGSRKKSESRKVEIVVTKKPRYDAREEWRCERAGLYYTSDGRCVAPAANAKRIKPGPR